MGQTWAKDHFCTLSSYSLSTHLNLDNDKMIKLIYISWPEFIARPPEISKCHHNLTNSGWYTVSLLFQFVTSSHNSQQHWLLYHLSHATVRDDAAQTVWVPGKPANTHLPDSSLILSCGVGLTVPDNGGLTIIMWTSPHNSLIARLSVSSSPLDRSPQSFSDLTDLIASSVFLHKAPGSSRNNTSHTVREIVACRTNATVDTHSLSKA